MQRILLFIGLVLMMNSTFAQKVRVATFNVSMEAGNYLSADSKPTGNELFELLASANNQQIRNIAAIRSQ